MKQPEECSNLQEIRAEIDRLDRQIIATIGQRFKYVKAASKFKTTETSVNSATVASSTISNNCCFKRLIVSVVSIGSLAIFA